MPQNLQSFLYGSLERLEKPDVALYINNFRNLCGSSSLLSVRISVESPRNCYNKVSCIISIQFAHIPFPASFCTPYRHSPPFSLNPSTFTLKQFTLLTLKTCGYWRVTKTYMPVHSPRSAHDVGAHKPTCTDFIIRTAEYVLVLSHDASRPLDE